MLSETEITKCTAQLDTSSEEEEEPPKPYNWSNTIHKIISKPNSHNAVVVKGTKGLYGIYECIGIKNSRPYYQIQKSNIGFWF